MFDIGSLAFIILPVANTCLIVQPIQQDNVFADIHQDPSHNRRHCLFSKIMGSFGIQSNTITQNNVYNDANSHILAWDHFEPLL